MIEIFVMANTITSLQLYHILQEKLGNHEAQALAGFIDTSMKEQNELNMKLVATKEDVKDLELKLSVKIAETKTDIVRWVFAIFIPLFLAILGLYIRK